MDKARQCCCYVVGAGSLYPQRLNPQPQDLVLAADGGYDSLQSLGMVPDMVVGDFDSAKETPNHPNLVALPREKDDTDMLAALRLGLEAGHSLFHLYGGTGGRVDHTMANLQCLTWLASQGCQGYLHGKDWVATVLKDGMALSFSPRETGYLSLFCQGDLAEGVNIQGLKYGLTDGRLSCDYPMGVSNEFIGQESRISVRKGALLVIWYPSALS